MLKKLLFPFLLFFIAATVLVNNFIPGTYLIGWDNLLPELDIKFNLARSLEGVWLSYRGLGVYDGQAHMANLIHTLFVSLLSTIIAHNALRYVVLTLLHFLGGLGFYYLIIKLLKKPGIAFVAALFYLFNLGTIQQFYAPFEPFAFHFATLPWLFLTSVNFISKKNRKNLVLLVLVLILSTPQNYIPTLFVSTVLAISGLAVYDFWLNRSGKRSLVVVALFLLINSFWLLPYGYGLIKNAKVISGSRINQYSSEENYLRNKNRGDLGNVLNFKGFMLDATEIDTVVNKNEKLLKVWDDYASTKAYQVSFWLLMAIAIIGLIFSKRTKTKVLFLPALLISFFFLANNTPIIREANDLLRQFMPILAEAYRFPFTKFIIIFVFAWSVFLALGLEYVVTRVKRAKKLMAILVMALVLVLAWPSFQGNFYANIFKREIPEQYFNVLNYFRNQNDNRRVLYLPATSFWSWKHYQWGYAGSGFLWFGLKQPLIDRAFDPWSKQNEQLFNEINYAIKTENKTLFNKVLKKYDIGYLIVDQNLLNSLSPQPINYSQLTRFLNGNRMVKTIAFFEPLRVYVLNKQNEAVIKKAASVNVNDGYFYRDVIYETVGDYYQTLDADYIYPFRNLFSEKLQSDLDFTVTETATDIVLQPKNLLTSNLSNQKYVLVIPDILKHESLIPFQISTGQNGLRLQLVEPRLQINNKIFTNSGLTYESNIVINPETRVEFLTLNTQAQNQETIYLYNQQKNDVKIINNNENRLIAINLSQIKRQLKSLPIQIKSGSAIKLYIPKVKSSHSLLNVLGSFNQDQRQLSTESDNQNLVFGHDQLTHQLGYVSLIRASYLFGLPIDFYVDNSYYQRSELDSKLAKNSGYLNTFFLPPSDRYYSGYGFHLMAKKIGIFDSKSTINNIEFYPVAYNTIANIHLSKLNKAGSNRVYFLSQAFDPGWRAYLNGRELKNHVLVNNWANGWVVPEGECASGDCQVKIIFWPQYLQFIGFGLLALALLWSLFLYKDN